VLTNLHPEHLEAHGGFEPYRAAKAKLFAHTAGVRRKRRVAIVPANLERPEAFTNHPFARVMTFTADDVKHLTLAPVLAAFPENAAAVRAVCEAMGVGRAAAERAISNVRSLPGRLERIDCGQPFDVIVDYAFTPDALEGVYRALGPATGRTVHVLGGAGGGRDRWKYPVTGKIAASHADVVIVTNEDPYDDDPMEIIHAVAQGAREWIASAPQGTLVEVHEVLDRREALATAVRLARPGDRIVVTGKGCEQAIAGPRGTLTPWDDRVMLRELLRARSLS
ncbi:MAG: cyanophycin synthetase, partial [bacterium]|nr:cyanophycin synthetase [bacterium]